MEMLSSILATWWFPSPLLVAVLVERWAGESEGWRPMGWLGEGIGHVRDALLRRAQRSGPRFIAGVFLVLLVGAAAWITGIAIEDGLSRMPPLRWVFEVLFLYACFGITGYAHAALRVRNALEHAGPDAAREELPTIGYPAAGDHDAIVSACASGIAETFARRYVGPLFFYALFGLTGALVYRAIIELEARVDAPYARVAPARIARTLSLVPRWIGATLIPLAGMRMFDFFGGWSALREGVRGRGASVPTAALAGTLGIELRTNDWSTGRARRTLHAGVVDEAWICVYWAAVIASVLALLAPLFRL